MNRSDLWILLVFAAGCTMIMPVAATTSSLHREVRSGELAQGSAPAARARKPLDGYELVSRTTMTLEAASPIRYRQERDRCYALVIDVPPGSTISKRVHRDGLSVGQDNDFEHVSMSQTGGSAHFCPLIAEKRTLDLFYILPTDHRLGHGPMTVELWSKKMPAAWVREELENRRIAERYEASQQPVKRDPRCTTCETTYNRCMQAGRDYHDDMPCWRAATQCRSDYKCL